MGDIRHNPLFDDLSVRAVVRLQKIAHRMTAESGKELCTGGEHGTAMYVIHGGHVRLTMHGGREDDPVILLGPGDSFCEEIISGLAERCDYTANAVDNVHLYMLSEDGFNDLFRSMPDVKDQVVSNARDIRRGRHRLFGRVQLL